MNDRVTIHIITRDRPAELYGLLVSILEQSFVSWDLIIVDDGTQPVLAFEFLQKVLGQVKIEGHKVIVEKAKDKGVVCCRNQCLDAELEHFRGGSDD